MNAKNLLVSFVLALFLVAGASAAPLADDIKVKVDGINVDNLPSVVAGEVVEFKIYFDAIADDTDVSVELTLEGEKAKAFASTGVFDVEADNRYVKTLTLEVPYELKDEKSDMLEVEVEFDGKTLKNTEFYTLKVQRPSYNAAVKSVAVPSSIAAGEILPVEVVVKNMGYNELEDLYVSASIKELDVSYGSKWFGDLVCLEDDTECCDEDDEDTAVGKLSLNVPYSAKAGVYTLEVVVENADTETVVTKQIVVANDVSENVIASNTAKTAAKGQEVVYDLLIVNPTNNVKVYTVVADSQDVSSTVSQSVIAVPAGSSKTVKVAASADVEGEYTFNVNVFEGENLMKAVAYDLSVEGKTVNTIFVLTVVLAVIFLVLLVALIVLLGKKPEKAEEFGESYY